MPKNTNFIFKLCCSLPLCNFSQEYFSGNYSQRWEEAFDTVDQALTNISLYLSCFDFDKFVGMRSEMDLEVSTSFLVLC